MKKTTMTLSLEEYKLLRDFTNEAEAMAGSDPEMPSHADTEARFDELLIEAKRILGLS